MSKWSFTNTDSAQWTQGVNRIRQENILDFHIGLLMDVTLYARLGVDFNLDMWFKSKCGQIGLFQKNNPPIEDINGKFQGVDSKWKIRHFNFIKTHILNRRGGGGEYIFFFSEKAHCNKATSTFHIFSFTIKVTIKRAIVHQSHQLYYYQKSHGNVVTVLKNKTIHTFKKILLNRRRVWKIKTKYKW